MCFICFCDPPQISNEESTLVTDGLSTGLTTRRPVSKYVKTIKQKTTHTFVVSRSRPCWHPDDREDRPAGLGQTLRTGRLLVGTLSRPLFSFFFLSVIFWFVSKKIIFSILFILFNFLFCFRKIFHTRFFLNFLASTSLPSHPDGTVSSPLLPLTSWPWSPLLLASLVSLASSPLVFSSVVALLAWPLLLLSLQSLSLMATVCSAMWQWLACWARSGATSARASCSSRSSSASCPSTSGIYCCISTGRPGGDRSSAVFPLRHVWEARVSQFCSGGFQGSYLVFCFARCLWRHRGAFVSLHCHARRHTCLFCLQCVQTKAPPRFLDSTQLPVLEFARPFGFAILRTALRWCCVWLRARKTSEAG